MLILGDVRQVREIAEGPDDGEGLIGVEAVENRPQLTPRRGLVVAVETDRGLANLLDQFEHLFAFLLADGVAEDPAEQADVVAQRHVFVGLLPDGTGQVREIHVRLPQTAVSAGKSVLTSSFPDAPLA